MKQALMTLLTLVVISPLWSQNLLIEVFSGANLTAYEPVEFEESQTYIPIGFRIAGGLPNIQLGGEFHTDISSASFSILDEAGGDVTSEFANSYYGGFIRGNISPNPAYGFGVIVKAGVGVYNVTQTNTATYGENEFDFGGTLGFNGGIGVSVPIGGAIHLEAGYMFNYVTRELVDAGIKEYNANHHSLQIGFSYNGIYGTQASRHRQNKRWKNGWRGAAGQRYKKWGKK